MARRNNSSPQTQAVLAALLYAEGWHYGYDLSKETSLKSGTLYPILIRLEAQGCLEARWEEPQAGRPPRHLYRLTGLGRTEALAFARPVNERRVVESQRPAREGAAQ